MLATTTTAEHLEPDLLGPVLLPPFELIAFDLDGTLTQTRSGRTFRTAMPAGGVDRHGQFYTYAVHSEADWEWLPRREETLKALHRRGTLLGICTNQGGISLGRLNEYKMAAELKRLASEAGVPLTWTMCTYYPRRGQPLDEHANYRRKPNPGMLEEMARHYHLEPDHNRCLFVGDRVEDQQAAEAAGFSFEWAAAFFHDGFEALRSQQYAAMVRTALQSEDLG